MTSLRERMGLKRPTLRERLRGQEWKPEEISPEEQEQINREFEAEMQAFASWG
jgi:hypothetical protein